MTPSIVFVFATLLHIAAAVSLLDGEYIVQMQGDCVSDCRKEMNKCLYIAGMKSCNLSDVVKIKSKSWGFVQCPQMQRVSRRIRNAHTSREGVLIERALRRAQHTNVSIERVDSDGEVRAYEIPLELWGLDEVDGVKNDRRCSETGLHGQGVDIYILDTGCRADYGAMCTSEFRNDTCRDENGHGTHVAGIATSEKWGVATRSTRHCLKVLKRHGYGSYAKMIKAISRVVAEQAKTGRPGVVNMSFGGERYSVINAAINEASGDGLYFTIAAGNTNIDACLLSPASAAQGDPHVFSVAAHDRNGKKAFFTNFGNCTDISAPGVNIVSENGYRSGTSMAAPYVAGAIAELLSDGKAVNIAALTGTRVVDGINKPALNISC